MASQYTWLEKGGDRHGGIVSAAGIGSSEIQIKQLALPSG